MTTKEHDRLSGLSDWYVKQQLDFDRRLIGFRYETIKPFCKGPYGLELGPAEGCMTQLLLDDFEELTVVEGAGDLLSLIPNSPRLIKVHSLFEEYQPPRQFNTIILDHILEHVDDPVDLLRKAREWLAPSGRLLAGVPNGLSIHRLVAVKMGLLDDPCQLNQRDHFVGHRRVYTLETFRKDLETAGLEVVEIGGVFFKPVSNQQIEDHWTEEMILGFYKLGKDFPENAAELYAVCQYPH